MPTPEEIAQIKLAPADPQVHELIRKRWSPRAFSAQEVSPEDLRILFQAAEWAASCFNEQPWRFIVATRTDQPDWNQLLDCLVEVNQTWAKHAPVLMLTAAKRTFTQTGKPNYHSLHDTGMALANLLLQAASMGLAAHAMAGFDRAKARTAFNIPEDYVVGASVAIGHWGDPASLPAKLQAAEIAPRTRKPLSDIVFSGGWGHPSGF
jgi:nitroreductase